MYKKIIKDGITMVTEERFRSMDYISTKIKNIEGCVVETGVWKGGMSIYLAHIFPKRTIWVCDSFKGCQDTNLAPYYFRGEVHTLGMYACPLSEVKNNFMRYNIPLDGRIKFLSGWFRDTIDTDTCEIDKIALLRFDGDAYSATMEVLNGLYNKVAIGGIIVFDDYCLGTCKDAVHDFLDKNSINVTLMHPVTNIPLKKGEVPCGVWFTKK